MAETACAVGYPQSDRAPVGAHREVSLMARRFSLPDYGSTVEAMGTVHLWIRGGDDVITADDRQQVYAVLERVAEYIEAERQGRLFEEV